MTAEPTTRQHLHVEDYPQTLRLLEDLRNGRPAEDWALIGYERTVTGAWVDWDQLVGSWLSSTEKAVVHVARGAATLERSGGPAPRMVNTVTSVMAKVCDDGSRRDEWMGAMFGAIDARRMQDLDPDIARALLDLDDGITTAMTGLGASDVTDADRATHAKEMRRQLAVLTEELTGRFDEWLEA